MDFLYLKDMLVSYTQTIRLNHLMTCGMVGESPYLLARSQCNKGTTFSFLSQPHCP